MTALALKAALQYLVAPPPIPSPSVKTVEDASFSDLDAGNETECYIWAVGAIHADAKELKGLHQRLKPKLRPNHHLVYLGNYFGYGQESKAVYKELQEFGQFFKAEPRGKLVYLRGQQEEMMSRLLQLEYAPDPLAVLQWVEQQGVMEALEGFGLSWALLRMAAYCGERALGDWTQAARHYLYHVPGYYDFIGELKRAAYSMAANTVMVNSGFDATKPLLQQQDSYWWDWQGFEQEEPENHEEFRLIVRGYDPLNRGLARGLYRLNLDGGSGRGGKLYAALISPKGVALQWL